MSKLSKKDTNNTQEGESLGEKGRTKTDEPEKSGQVAPPGNKKGIKTAKNRKTRRGQGSAQQEETKGMPSAERLGEKNGPAQGRPPMEHGQS